jgi:hypothetical protein
LGRALGWWERTDGGSVEPGGRGQKTGGLDGGGAFAIGAVTQVAERITRDSMERPGCGLRVDGDREARGQEER